MKLLNDRPPKFMVLWERKIESCGDASIDGGFDWICSFNILHKSLFDDTCKSFEGAVCGNVWLLGGLLLLDDVKS